MKTPSWYAGAYDYYDRYYGSYSYNVSVSYRSYDISRAMANNSTATRGGRYGTPVRNARPPRFAMGTVANVAANQA